MSERGRTFERQWPVVEAKLKRVLAARNVPVSDRDDLLQEVAVRALTSGIVFTSADAFVPWASTVLRNLHVDALRRHNRRPGEPLALDSALESAADNVETRVEARFDAATAARFVAGLSAEDRESLLGDTDGVRQSSTFYVRRHRLRRKLLEAIEGLGGIWIGIQRRLGLPNGTAPAWGAQVAALGATVVVLSLVTGGVPSTHTPDSGAGGDRERTAAAQADLARGPVLAAHVSPAPAPAPAPDGAAPAPADPHGRQAADSPAQGSTPSMRDSDGARPVTAVSAGDPVVDTAAPPERASTPAEPGGLGGVLEECFDQGCGGEAVRPPGPIVNDDGNCGFDPRKRMALMWTQICLGMAQDVPIFPDETPPPPPPSEEPAAPPSTALTSPTDAVIDALGAGAPQA